MVNSSFKFITRPSLLKCVWYLFSVFPLVGLSCITPCYASLTPIDQDSDKVVRSAPSLESDTLEQLAKTNNKGDHHEDRLEQATPVAPPKFILVSELTPAPPTSAPYSTTILVEKIEVIGNTVLEGEINGITQPLEGETVTREKLQEVVDTITQLYLNQGFLTSRAVLVEASLPTGRVEIQIIEGSVEEIEIEGTQRLRNYVRSRVQLGTGTPLNTPKLEDQLRLLRTDPLFKNIEASLRAGTGVGKSILTVRVTEANPFVGNLGYDNYSPPSVGGERLGLNLLYRAFTGLGDEIAASYRPRTETLDGTYRLELRYRTPLNAKNGTLELRTLIDRNKVVQEPFDVLEIQGESERYEIAYRQPLIRTPREELALSLGFVYRDRQTFTFAGPTPFGFGPEADGVTKTSVFNFGQDYTRRDTSGAWAFRSQFRLGTGLFDATTNPSPIPGGKFFSWLGQVQRVQLVNENNFLIVQLDLQLTPDPLFPSEQFVIGGGQSVRGYRQNVLTADNGVRFSVEDRITVVRNKAREPVLILAPFFDMGGVWNVGDNPNSIIEGQRFIAGLGLGVLLQPVKGLNLRLDYAPPLIDLDFRGDNVQDDGFYFSVISNF
ncbi:MAG: ShlB/FhaC/HecB family hemolysin secretion/activation protein [Xenococcaceae cyanobacterium]